MKRLQIRKQYGSFSELILLIQLELEVYGGGMARDESDDEGPCNNKQFRLNTVGKEGV